MDSPARGDQPDLPRIADYWPDKSTAGEAARPTLSDDTAAGTYSLSSGAAGYAYQPRPEPPAPNPDHAEYRRPAPTGEVPARPAPPVGPPRVPPKREPPERAAMTSLDDLLDSGGGVAASGAQRLGSVAGRLAWDREPRTATINAEPVDPAMTAFTQELPRLITPPPPPRRRHLRVAAAALGASLFLGASVVVLSRMVTGSQEQTSGSAAEQPPVPVPSAEEIVPAEPAPNPPVSVAPEPSSPATTAPPATPPSSAAPAAGPAFAAGVFEMAGNATEFTLTMGRPAQGRAISVNTPGGGITGAVAVDGSRVTVTTKRSGRGGTARIDVLLDDRIAWDIRMSGGVKEGALDLAGGRIRAVDLSGGAETIVLALPGAPRGLPVRMSGGVRTFQIRTEREAPVRVQVKQGAGAVTLYGRKDQGVRRGSVLARGSGDGLEVEAVAGMGSLTVSTASGR